MQERLQKILAQAGIASRREAEKVILAGRVKVNSKIIKELGSKVDRQKDTITVDGKKISTEKKKYYLFNKPKGVITSLSDPQGRKSLADYVKKLPERIFPVGRLDYNTEGVLLLTNDGDLSQLLTHPKHNVDKTYKVGALGIITEEELDKLRLGIKLEDGITAPAIVNLIEYQHEKNITVFDITIHEGRNRQVRRMCDAIGHSVRNLQRTKFANLLLNGIKRGCFRELENNEVQNLYNLTRVKKNV